MYTVAKAIVATALAATAVTVGSVKVLPKAIAAIPRSLPALAYPDGGAPPKVATAAPQTAPRADVADDTGSDDSAPAASDARTDTRVQARSAARSSNDAEVQQLRAEIAELQQRTIMLEQQAQRDHDTFQAMAQQMSDIRDATVSRETREQGRADRAEQNQAATVNLLPVLQALQQGQSDNLSAALDQAEATYQGAALRDVQSAHAALDNNDLASARYFLTLAIQDAEVRR